MPFLKMLDAALEMAESLLNSFVGSVPACLLSKDSLSRGIDHMLEFGRIETASSIGDFAILLVLNIYEAPLVDVWE